MYFIFYKYEIEEIPIRVEEKDFNDILDKLSSQYEIRKLYNYSGIIQYGISNKYDNTIIRIIGFKTLW